MGFASERVRQQQIIEIRLPRFERARGRTRYAPRYGIREGQRGTTVAVLPYVYSKALFRPYLTYLSDVTGGAFSRQSPQRQHGMARLDG